MQAASGSVVVLGSRLGANQQAAWRQLWQNFMLLQLVTPICPLDAWLHSARLGAVGGSCTCAVRPVTMPQAVMWATSSALSLSSTHLHRLYTDAYQRHARSTVRTHASSKAAAAVADQPHLHQALRETQPSGSIV